MAKPHTCKHCGQDFEIFEEDEKLLQKISAAAVYPRAIPLPTLCPHCRMVRRMSYRNERSLYWRACALCGKETLSMYAEDKGYRVYCSPCWWSDAWDPLSFGKEYDPARSFFEQFADFARSIPFPALMREYATLENTQYSNQGGYLSDCYMVFNTSHCEKAYYVYSSRQANSCMDSLNLRDSERVYEGYLSQNCFNCAFVDSCRMCRDSWFLDNCFDCEHCLGCVGLRNKRYHIFNTPYSREDYEEKKRQLRLDTHSGLEAFRKEFETFRARFPVRYRSEMETEDSTGNYLRLSKNLHQAFITNGVENGRYIQNIEGNGAKDVMDYTIWGRDTEIVYECETVGLGCFNMVFSRNCWKCRDVEYSWHCHNSHDLFACIGLRNKAYCIFNRQYEEKEYRERVGQIMAHMKAKGEYGEFFPAHLSPFGYNETMAQECFPLAREQALARGYLWYDSLQGNTEIVSTKIPEAIDPQQSEQILKEVYPCAHKGHCDDGCSGNFKVMPQELAFYIECGLPLPTMCYRCRQSERLKKRLPFRLWDRSCAQCNAAIQTSYAPDSTAVVLCGTCYDT